MSNDVERTVAVVGATGVVGGEIIALLQERSFPMTTLLPLASSRSFGQSIEYAGEEEPVQLLTPKSFSGVDLAFFATPEKVSREFVPLAAEAGTLAIDLSRAFAESPEVPLVLPEVNLGELDRQRGIVACPSCPATLLALVLAPLHRRARIRRAVVASYQCASEAGRRGMEELSKEAIHLLNGSVPPPSRVHPRRLAFNCIPQVDRFGEDGATREEQLLASQTARLLGDPSLKISATCVRVPVFASHSQAVNLEFERELTPEEARELLRQAPGLVVMDDPAHGVYPTTIESSSNDPCFVGRVRRDATVPHGLQLWLVADNLRRGAALNAVQIAERLVETPRN